LPTIVVGHFRFHFEDHRNQKADEHESCENPRPDVEKPREQGGTHQDHQNDKKPFAVNLHNLKSSNGCDPASE
jgi:hypothetical protein